MLKTAPLWKPWDSESPMVTIRCAGPPFQVKEPSTPTVGSKLGTRGVPFLASALTSAGASSGTTLSVGTVPSNSSAIVPPSCSTPGGVLRR